MNRSQSNEFLILGTAGHIDHGKTVLVKALTGTDTDRLKEEKARGISIDLGFAHLALPSGRLLGIVDVPGHERFVKNMLAGATGIDLVLLVVAADDGVMPQTREHLAIVDLLGIRHGVVAITKKDLADADWLELVREDVKAAVAGTALEAAPIVSVSAKTGEGIEELVTQLDRISAEAVRHEDEGPIRLPIDRVFTLPGAGTVVTGTLWSGELKPEDKVVIEPKGVEARVRSVQVHGHKEDTARAGQRVALNLAGLAKEQVDRGDVVLKPGYLAPSVMVDAKVRLLKDAPRAMKNRVRVRIHHGTTEALGRVVLLEGDELKPGESGMAQVRLETPVVPKRGDRIIIRSYSPILTIGGGHILDSHPRKHKRFDTATVERLGEMVHPAPKRVVEMALEETEWPVTAVDVVKRTELAPEEVEAALSALTEGGTAMALSLDKAAYYARRSNLEFLEERLSRYLGEFHLENPLQKGADKQKLRSIVFDDAPVRLFEGMLAYFVAKGVIRTDGHLVAQAGATLELGADEEKTLGEIAALFAEHSFTPPDVRELAQSLGKPEKNVIEYLKILVEDGKIERVTQDMYFDKQVLGRAEAQIRQHLESHEGMTVSDFRQLVGTSRKYALPLLNWFDSRGLTRREGDLRVLKR